MRSSGEVAAWVYSISIPDEVAEQFRREVLDCPDCATPMNEPSIDWILAGPPRKARDH